LNKKLLAIFLSFQHSELTIATHILATTSRI